MSLDTGYISVHTERVAQESCWVDLLDSIENNSSRCIISTAGSLIIPLGEDDYEWESVGLSLEQIKDTVKKKLNQRELIGFSLYRADGSLDDTLTVISKFEDESIIFSIPDNCKKIKDTSVTDFSYYLDFIVPVCFQAFGVLSITCKQYIDR